LQSVRGVSGMAFSRALIAAVELAYVALATLCGPTKPWRVCLACFHSSFYKCIRSISDDGMIGLSPGVRMCVCVCVCACVRYTKSIVHCK